MPIQTTQTSAKAWSPDVQGFVPGDAVPTALILNTSTVAGTIEGDEPALRVPYVLDDDATWVPEGELIPEADPQLAEVVVTTAKIAQLVRVSREQLLQPNASQLIMTSLSRAVTKAADRAYLAAPAPAAGAAGSTGLLNVGGILDGGAVGASLDTLSDAVAAIEGNGGTASHVVASPGAWAALTQLRATSGGAATLLGAGTQSALRLVLGLPVLTSAEMPPGELLVIDRTAVVSAAGPVQLTQSTEAYFAYDSAGIRVTWRIGWNVMRPGRLARLTIA